MASGTSAALERHVDSLRKCWLIFSCEKGRADVKISHDQSLHASNCPVLLQKKSPLHC